MLLISSQIGIHNYHFCRFIFKRIEFIIINESAQCRFFARIALCAESTIKTKGGVYDLIVILLKVCLILIFKRCGVL